MSEYEPTIGDTDAVQHSINFIKELIQKASLAFTKVILTK
jgi:hypothetical protein